MHSLRDVVAVLQIPFLDDGEVDWEGLAGVASHAAGNGASALAFGYGSEFPKLAEDEREQAVAVAVEACRGRTPVVAWCSADSTKAACRLVCRAREVGASAAVVTPPRGAEGLAQLRRHLDAVAAEGLPLVVQDAPEQSQVQLSVEQMAELCAIPAVVALKVESHPSWVRMRAIRQRVGKAMSILGGSGGLYLWPELAAGSDGVMPGAAHPWLFAKVIRAFRDGRPEEALERYSRSLPYLVASCHRLNDFVWIQKELLRRLGVIGSPALRQPGEAPDAFARQVALDMAERLGLLDRPANET